MIGVSNSYNGYTNSLEGRRDQLKRIAEHDIEYIHWQYDGTGYYIYSSYEMEMYKNWVHDLGLKVHSVHASEGGKNASFPFSDRQERFKVRNYWDNLKDFTSENEYARKAGVELIKNRIDLAAALGTDSIVLHVLVPYGEIMCYPELKEQFYKQVIKSFKELQPYCLDKGVSIAIENLFTQPYEWEKEKFDILYSEFPKEVLSFCFDSGHGKITTPHDELSFLRAYKDRLVCLHLHENDGHDDTHTIPFQVDNGYNWEGFADIMSTLDYSYPMLFETTMSRSGTCACESAFFSTVTRAGKKLWSMIEASKRKPL